MVSRSIEIGGQPVKIKVQLQGNKECALSSIAAVTGKSLEEIRSRACKIAGIKHWSDVSTQFWPSLEQLGHDLGIKGIIEQMKINIGPQIRLGVTRPVLPKKGRGIVIIESPQSAHAMPYQAGLVYDPNCPHIGIPLEDMMHCWAGYSIRNIIRFTDDSLQRDCPTCGAAPGKHCHYPSGYTKQESHAARKHLPAARPAGII